MKKEINLDTNEESLNISKSQKKRDAESLYNLGVKLITFKEEELKKLDLPEKLFEEILIAKRISSHIALKRQKQFIGKLIRNYDIEPIISAITAHDFEHIENTKIQHLIEEWIEALLSNNKEVINRIIKHCPNIDVQHMRNLQRNAIKDITKEVKTGRRTLFRYLKEMYLDDPANKR